MVLLTTITNILPFPALNDTLLPYLSPPSPSYPLYHPNRNSLLPFISDKYLSLAAPIVFYWAVSLVFHAIDLAEHPYFEARRIHESEEVKKKNRATVRQVVEAVIFQQIVQTILGFFWLENEEEILRREVWKDHVGEMAELGVGVGKLILVVLGGKVGENVIREFGRQIVPFVYWWGIPFIQMILAFFLIDTWQYFLHRLMHTVPFLYRHFHSVHHRLYVPYAFGALYNHPVEGLLLDTLGAALAHMFTGMTIRQGVVLFSLSTIKTVDDHCGYRIWWDPAQWMFRNNADYHDMHHQAWGIKRNFSQPFFIVWDEILGTRMTREEASARFGKKRYTSHPSSTKISTIPSQPQPIAPSEASDPQPLPSTTSPALSTSSLLLSPSSAVPSLRQTSSYTTSSSDLEPEEEVMTPNEDSGKEYDDDNAEVSSEGGDVVLKMNNGHEEGLVKEKILDVAEKVGEYGMGVRVDNGVKRRQGLRARK